MNISICDLEIVNLDSVTCVRRFTPGDKIPYSTDSSTRWTDFIVWFQFSTLVTKLTEPKPAILFFRFADERDWNAAWAEIKSLMETRELSWPLKIEKGSDGNEQE